ncbi:MAG: hypothetical protein AB9897_04155 [Anaerolineaceae bacterium]
MPVCSSCGGSFADSYKFCPYCGREKPISQQMNVVAPLEDLVHACPVCHKNDKVEKVSVIYSRGTQHTQMTVPVNHVGKDFFTEETTYTTSYEQMHGTNESQLAQELRPPQKPVQPYRYQSRHGIWWKIGSVPASIYCAGGILTGLIENNRGAFIVLFILLFVGFMAFFFWLSKFLNNRYQKRDEEFDAKLAEWNLDIDAWNHLYFCFRDGKVFESSDAV